MAKKGKSKKGKKGLGGTDAKIQARMDSLDKAWAEGREVAKNGGGSQLPNGEYTFRIESGVVRFSKTEKLGGLFTLVVANEQFAGTKVTDWNGLESEQGPRFLADKLHAAGCELDDINSMSEAAEAMASFETLREAGEPVFVTAEVRNNPPYMNVYFRERRHLDPDDVEINKAGKSTVKKKKKQAVVEADDDDEDEDEDVDWEKGMECQVEIDGEWVPGTIKKADEDEDEYKVKPAKGKAVTVTSDELKTVEDDDDPEEDEDEDEDEDDEDEESDEDTEESEEEEEDEDDEDLEEGTAVSFAGKVGKKTGRHEGVVKSCEDGVAKVKPNKGKKILELPVESLTVLEEDDEEDDDAVEPEKGMKVSVEIKGKTKKGKIKKVDKKEQTCVVDVKGKTYEVEWDDLTLAE